MPPEEADIFETDLWDYHNHEHHREKSSYYVYSGDYIRKEKTVTINNKDLSEVMDKLFYAAAGLVQPRIRINTDMDGDIYVKVFGWVEMTPEDHGRREHLRLKKAEKQAQDEDRFHKEHVELHNTHIQSCPFCRRG